MKIGDRVQTVGVGNTKVYASATATTEIGLQPLGAVGVIIGGKTNGRWKVDFDTGFDGWVWEQRLGPYVPALTPPVNVTRPAITPTTVVLGEPNTVTPGTWTGDPTPTLTEEWMVEAPGGAGPTFTPAMSVKVRETATNTQGTAFVDSDPVPAPEPPPPPPPNTKTKDLVADFGAVAGNTSAAITATTNALTAFHQWAQKQTRPPGPGYTGYPGFFADADPNIMIKLTVPAGDYHHTYNRFGWMLRKFQWVGAGSGLAGGPVTEFTCHSTSDWFAACPFRGNIGYFHQVPNQDYGYRIETVAAGATTVALQMPMSAKLAKFVPGHWCLIHSYNQQPYGEPPNMRYYDYAKVVSVDAVAGIVTFDTPTVFEHRADYPYVGSTVPGDQIDDGTGWTPAKLCGPARIAPIDRPDHPVGEYHEYRGLRIHGNPSWNPSAWGPQDSADNFFAMGLIDGLMQDVWIDNAMAHSLLRDFRSVGCKWQYDESDKICRLIHFQDCDIAGSYNHAGQLQWTMIGGHLGEAWISCRNGLLQGVTIRGTVNLNRPDQVINFTMDGCTAVSGFSFNGDPHYTFTIGSGDVSLVSSTKIKIAKNSQVIDSPWARIIEFWGADGVVIKNGELVSGAKIVRITGDATYDYVAYSGVTLANGDTISSHRINEIVVKNCVGQNTGKNWSAPFDGVAQSTANLTWSGNSGN